jgi:hypothetical protein
MHHPCLGLAVSIFCRAFRTGWLFALALAACANQSVCQSPQLTSAEQLILRRLADGGEADLSDAAFGTRKISTGLINKLLSGGLKSLDPAGNMNLYGIAIKNAVFEDQVNIHFEVPYSVQFKNCRFVDGIDFSGSQFDKDLNFDSDVFGLSPEDLTTAPASYDSSEVGVEFTGATVNGTLSFLKGFFYAPIDLTKAHAKELDLTDATYGWTGQDPDIDLTASRVDSDLSLSVGARQPKQVTAQFLNVGGSASFGNGKTAFFATHNFDLTYTHFQNLAIYGLPHWLSRAHDESASLDGFSFQEISFPPPSSEETKDAGTSNDTKDCNGEEPSPSTLLCLLDSPKTQYSTEPYLQLQQNLTASGHAGRANSAYIHMRNRQRRERLNKPVNLLAAFIAWLVDWFLYITIGYGRWPWLAGIWAIVFIGVGMWVFQEDRMKEQDGDAETETPINNPGSGTRENKARYSPFWYSLDVMAPAIELGVDKAWEPDPAKPNYRFVQTYSYFHRIAGWILVPLVAIALSGLVHL